MLLGYAAGRVMAPGFRFVSAGQRRSFLFQCAFNNYSFLPLPLVGMLWGEKAMGRLILSSLGAELAIWTLGIWILAAGRRAAADEDAGDAPHHMLLPLARLVTPVLVAMAAAAGVLLLRDGAGFGWLPSWAVPAGGALWDWAMKVGEMIGKATIPLAMTVAGASIARMRRSELRNPLVWRAGAIRLLMVPLLALLALQWLPLDTELRQVLQVVAVMPSAIVSIMFCKVYGGDEHFTTGTVLLTHVLALATVPLLLALVL